MDVHVDRYGLDIHMAQSHAWMVHHMLLLMMMVGSSSGSMMSCSSQEIGSLRLLKLCQDLLLRFLGSTTRSRNSTLPLSELTACSLETSSILRPGSSAKNS